MVRRASALGTTRPQGSDHLPGRGTLCAGWPEPTSSGRDTHGAVRRAKAAPPSLRRFRPDTQTRRRLLIEDDEAHTAAVEGGPGAGHAGGRLIAAMGMVTRGMMRRKATHCDEPGPDDPKWTDDELIEVMLQHPIPRPPPQRCHAPGNAPVPAMEAGAGHAGQPATRRVHPKEAGEQAVEAKGPRIPPPPAVSPTPIARAGAFDLAGSSAGAFFAFHAISRQSSCSFCASASPNWKSIQCGKRNGGSSCGPGIPLIAVLGARGLTE